MKLQVRNLQKSFGEKKVLCGIDFLAESGKAFGLLGRNGAGKTTTIRIIMQVFAPDSGDILLNGENISSSHVKIGYLPEERGLYPKRTIKDQLVYIGMLKGLSRSEAEINTKKWLNRLEVSGYYNVAADTLSKGNQQKIQLAMTLLGEPDIIILDEPFSGLDPVNAQIFKSVVRELMDSGKLLIFSSHQMNQVEEFCNQIAIINGGKIVLEGSLKTIKKSYERKRLLISADYKKYKDKADQILLDAFNALKDKGAVQKIEQHNGKFIFILQSENDKETVFKEIAQQNITLEHFEILEPTLEEIFIEKAGDSQ